MDAVGQALKKLRESHRFSQEELAQKAGMSMNALSKLERGMHSPSRLTMRGLAEAFGLTVDELEGKLRGETVSVDFPREVYDLAVEKAAAKGMTVEDWLTHVIAPKLDEQPIRGGAGKKLRAYTIEDRRPKKSH